MALDYDTLELLRQKHPAWRLLCAKHAPLVACFLHRAFIVPNVRSISQADLVEALEDELYLLREQLGSEKFPGTAQGYLDDWADAAKGWLRKFYPTGTDEPHFDLTPATEKVIKWLSDLSERSFVGTESRLLTLFELLRQMSEGSQTDPQIRIVELQKRRDAIDADIARILAGDIPLLDDTALKDRFQQFVQLSRELLTDFREVEHNFRNLDRHVRERMTLWEGGKGTLLQDIMGQRDAIADSDQGKSFKAFWDFLMSQSRQDELSRLLEHVLTLPPIRGMIHGDRLQHVHHDWLEAGEHTQKTVAKLSEQLRRFLDDQAWLENRRIMDILHNIETHALALRDDIPSGDFVPLDDISTTIDMPLERPLYRKPVSLLLEQIVVDHAEADVDVAILYSQITIDWGRIQKNIQQSFHNRDQISLVELISLYPLRNGLAELVAYIQLAGKRPNTFVLDDVQEKVSWQTDVGTVRQATIPRIVLMRNEL